MVAVEELLSVERARVKRFERDFGAETKKRPQLSAERWETSQTANRQLAEEGESLQELQSKIATVTAELKE